MLNKFKNLLFQWGVSLPAKIFAGLVVFYFLFAYFAVNPLAKKLVPWIAEEQLASQASVGKVEFDPLRLKATVEDFKLTEKSGPPLAGIEKLVVDLEASGIFDWAWKLKEISITAPQASIAISKTGKLNWADLIAKLNEDPTPPDESLPRVVIGHIAVSRGDITFEDANRASPFKAALAPLDFELDGFSTLPQDRGDYLIAAKFAEQAGTLKWKGDMGVNPVASKGAIAVENVKLAKLLQIIKTDAPPFKSESGDIAAHFSYDFSLVNDQPKVVLEKIALALHAVSGELNQVGKVALNHVELIAPRLNFSIQNAAPSLQLQNIALTLDNLSFQQDNTLQLGLKNATIALPKLSLENKLMLEGLDVKLGEISGSKGKDTHFALKQASATLPQLEIATQADSNTQFEQLNLAFNDIKLTHGKDTLLALPALHVNNIHLDLAARQANIEQVLLPKGLVSASRDKAGVINWEQAFTSPEAKAPETPAQTDTTPTEPFSVAIDDVQLQHWRVAFQDDGFVHPLQVNVVDFNLDLAVQSPQGKLAIQKLQTKAFGITAVSDKVQVASLDKLDLAQGDIQLDAQKIGIQAITLAGLKTAVIKETNKPLNWQTILEPVTHTSQQKTAAKPAKKKPDWAVSLKKLALANANIHVEDKSNTTPVVLDIEQAGVEIKDATLDMTRALPVKAAFKVKQGGHFETQGKLTPQPLKADLELKLADLALTPFAPYINQFAMLKLNNGAANLTGKLALKPENALAFNGGFSVDKLALVEEANDAPFMAWDKLGSDDLELTLAPNRLHMSTLNIVKPSGKFIIHEDKSMNVTRILRKQATANTSVATTQNNEEPVADNAKAAEKPVEESATQTVGTTFGASAAPKATEEKPTEAMTPPPVADNTPEAFPVSIETVRINNAELEFADLSLTPQFGTHIHSLTGVINGVSTNASSTAQVELDGKVDDYGAARIRGALQPFKATNFTDLKLVFTNLEMNRLTPYSGKFAGRKIESGKLSVDLEYKIKQRKLAGENKFVINKLKLGEKVDSKDAANLPLDLAIAILEDSDGVIDLDLPISGSLDDPKFSYGSIVWKAIKNVLGKIVTAPFRALGKLFGGSGDKLEAITFEAGSTVISPPEQEKLKAVSTALAKRPGLSLGVVPGFDTALDTRALQENTIRQQVAEELGIKLAEGQAPGPVDLTNPKVQKVVEDLHDKLTKKGLLKRLASKLEKPKPGHYEQALEKLVTSVEIKDVDLQALAKARGEAIQKHLADAGIAKERVHADAPIKSAANGKVINTKLTLDVKAAKNQPVDSHSSPEKSQ